LRIEIDYDRAAYILQTLRKVRQENQFPYFLPEVIPPQIPERMPKGLVIGSPDHVSVLFNSCLIMRGTINSQTAMQQMYRLWEAHRRPFFDPREAMKMDEEWAKEILWESGVRYNHKQNAGFWIKNAEKLCEYWEGNLLKLFEGAITYEEAYHRMIRNNGSPYGFYGFRHKMASLLIYFLTWFSLIDRYSFPFPADFQVSRLFITNGVFRFIDYDGQSNLYAEPFLGEMRKLSLWFEKEYGVDGLEQSDIFWLFASTMCEHNPGNRRRMHPGDYSSESRRVYRGRKVRFIEDLPEEFPGEDKLKWTWRDVREYNRYCRFCPLRETCTLNMPWAYHYRQGRMRPAGEREKPPVNNLDLFDSAM